LNEVAAREVNAPAVLEVVSPISSEADREEDAA
jgi:hypothetical protein